MLMAGRTYCSLGNAFCKLGDFKKSIHFYNLALDIAKDVGDKDGENAAFANLGNVFRGILKTSKTSSFNTLTSSKHRGTELDK